MHCCASTILALGFACWAATAPAGDSAPGLTVAGTEFRLTLADGRVLRSAELRGAILKIGDDGAVTQVRIDAVEPDPTDKSAEVLLHMLSVYDEAANQWVPLCEVDPAGKRFGFPYPLDADGAQFALTCTAGAEGKCIRMGYRPWKTARDGTPLHDHFRACIHMLRADYCGDDRPATRDGTTVDVYDGLDLQNPTRDPAFHFEAAWGAEGAVCVAHTRLPDVLTLEELHRRCPRIATAPSGSRCTYEAMRNDPRALIFNSSKIPAQ